MKKLLQSRWMIASLAFFLASSVAAQGKFEILIKSKDMIHTMSYSAQDYGAQSESITNRLIHLKFASKKDLAAFLEDHQDMIESMEQVQDLFLPPTFDQRDYDPSLRVGALDRFSEQWGMEDARDHDVNAEKMWEHSQGSSEIIVAVIDTGVNINHPDLKDAIWSNPGEIPGNGIDDDGNGYVDDSKGWDFANNDNNPADGSGHGTHCAGVIAGQGKVIWGVAPRVKVMPLKFLSDSGSGSTADAIKAIYYAINNGAKVLSNSWGGGGRSSYLEEAIRTAKDKGILFVAAAGNSRQRVDINPSYPGSYKISNVLSVAASDRYSNLASFSNYSGTDTFISAPGVSILSTYGTDGYSFLSGTSMATPFVSGIAALMLSINPDLTPIDIKNILLATTKKRSKLDNKVIADGISDGGAAVEFVADGSTPEPDEFDPEQIKIKKYSTKKWYQIYHRVQVQLSAPTLMYNQIKEVKYVYQKNKYWYYQISDDIRWQFAIKFKTKYPEKAVKVEITLKDGREFRINR